MPGLTVEAAVSAAKVTEFAGGTPAATATTLVSIRR